MKLIKPSVEILEQEDLFKHIELCARTCYKSEDKITDDSAEKFVQMLINKGHTAMLEHATVYLKDVEIIARYSCNPYSKVTYTKDYNYATTNYRVLLENNWLDDLRFQTEPTEYHQNRISVKFVCCRSISHELVRHRVFSFAQESTRYCNYSKDKFNNEITFIIPSWLDLKEGVFEIDAYGNFVVGNEETGITVQNFWLHSLKESESSYFKLLSSGWQPQQARAVLPNSLKTEIVMTGFIYDWEHFFGLRTAQSAHPQMRELAIPLYEMFKERNLIKT